MNTHDVFDRFAAFDSLRKAGFEDAQAQAIGDAIDRTVRDGAVTKHDLAEVKTELKADIAAVRTELKADIAAVRTELKADIAAVKTELKGDIAAVRTDIAKLETRIILWLVGLLITIIPAAAALAALVYKHIS